MFYSDKPISSNNEDKLNRKGFAKLLAHTLVISSSYDEHGSLKVSAIFYSSNSFI